MTDRCVPGKRLRNWHRRYGQGLTLRAFVRGVAALQVPVDGVVFNPGAAQVAKAWLASKGARP